MNTNLKSLTFLMGFRRTYFAVYRHEWSQVWFAVFWNGDIVVSSVTISICHVQYVVLFLAVLMANLSDESLSSSGFPTVFVIAWIISRVYLEDTGWASLPRAYAIVFTACLRCVEQTRNEDLIRQICFDLCVARRSYEHLRHLMMRDCDLMCQQVLEAVLFPWQALLKQMIKRHGRTKDYSLILAYILFPLGAGRGMTTSSLGGSSTGPLWHLL